MSSFYKENVERIANYLAKGSKREEDFALGFELEHFIVDKKSSKSIGYFGERGAEKILESLSQSFPNSKKTYEDGHFFGLDTEEFSLSLEPACQLEISTKRTNDIEEIVRIYKSFRKRLDPILDEMGLKCVNFGYQPASCVEELELIPKKRYEFMDRYFASLGGMGRNMMRGTASLQVSIDYSSEADFRLKYRVAAKLMPILKYISFNSPVFEGEKNPDPMLRSKIWRNTDYARVRYPNNVFAENFSFRDYAEFVYNQTLIFVEEDGEKDGKYLYDGRRTVAEYYDNTPLEKDDISYLLSIVFPIIRAKGFLELRGPDSVDIDRGERILNIVKGIFYNREALNAFDKFFDVGLEDIRAFENSLRVDLDDAIAYKNWRIDKTLRKTLDFAEIEKVLS